VSSGDDKVTHASRDSSNRSNRQKSSGRVEKLKRRAAAHQAAQGLAELPKQENPQLQNGKKLRDSMRQVDMFQRMFEMQQEYFRVPNLSSDTKDFPDSLVRSPDVLYPRCSCCNKVWDEWHKASALHQKNIAVIQKLNELCGTVGHRVLGQGVVLKMIGPSSGELLTQRMMRDFWGEQVQDLGAKAWSLINQVGGVSIKYSANKPMFHLLAEFVEGCETGVVPFNPEESKYGGQGSEYIHWIGLPPDLSKEQEQEEDEVGMDVIDYQYQKWKAKQRWWPVASISIKQCPSTKWIRDISDIWAVCVYQLCDLPLVAWALPSAQFVEIDED